MARYPRVEWLEYFMRTSSSYDFSRELATSGRLDNFDYKFQYHRAVFRPRVQFETLESARNALEPRLEAWWVSGLVSQWHGAPTFEFMDAAVAKEARGANVKVVRPRPMPPTLTLSLGEYPPRPSDLSVNDCVRDLAEHLASAVEDNWRSMLLHAYAMLTRVVAEHGSMRDASTALLISVERLRYTKHLASVRGVGGAARKYASTSTNLDLAGEEHTWLRETMTELLKRSSRLAAGQAPGPLLTGRPAEVKLGDRVRPRGLESWRGHR